MRLVSWNLHGAAIPGSATLDKQHRAWAHIRELGADIVLAQEVGESDIPEWVSREWTLLHGERGVGRKAWSWGSVIAARPGMNLRPRPDAFDDPWIRHLYDLVLVGELDLPGVGPVVVASVHTVAQSLPSYLKETGGLDLVSDSAMKRLQRPGYRGRPYVNDFAFEALDRFVGDRRFLISGDWNTARKFDKPRSRAGTAFFERAASHGWVGCHHGPEEPSHLGRGEPIYQLDHAFADPATAACATRCWVVLDDVVRSVSDHAPLVVDLGV
ncbi:MAG: hypothetical protein IT460_17575 [Planctomycetes bacterium]|nr:hypothetical protein [Planctomycetota bacterium]